MSIRYSIAQRTPALNVLFAGAACAITLALAAGPAMADTTAMERVNVRGRVVEAPVRYDVHASCAGIDDQIREDLSLVAARTRATGEVHVQFVVEGGRVEGVQARGHDGVLNRNVRDAVRRLSCSSQSMAGAQIYRFTVAFVDGGRWDAQQTAGNAHAVTLRVASAH